MFTIPNPFPQMKTRSRPKTETTSASVFQGYGGKHRCIARLAMVRKLGISQD